MSSTYMREWQHWLLQVQVKTTIASKIFIRSKVFYSGENKFLCLKFSPLQLDSET